MNLDAYTRHERVKVSGVEDGPLRGTVFSAKDNFDVAGHRTSAGNPTWLQTHNKAIRTAPAVQTLLDAGSTLLGKTLMDELAYGLTGRNVHYGTPLNPAAPERVPGGSSSGSASAVAGRACDFAIGTDTGGSVRVPASYCGLFGMRPTHGRISTEGVVPLAPSFDAVGWFARDAELLERVGRAMLDESTELAEPARLLVAVDALHFTDAEVHQAMLPWIGRARSFFDETHDVEVAGPAIADWVDTFRYLSAAEAWACHGEWLSSVTAKLAPDVASRFDFGRRVDAATVAERKQKRDAVRAHMSALMTPGTILCLPTAATPAPLLDADEATLDRVRQRTLPLTCIAGLAGLPQITLPAGFADEAPVGISFVGPVGEDAMLLNFVRILTTPAPTEPPADAAPQR
ncbi:MAG: amidase [Alphaproteobacteria bacterium]|nr:amidase [Alphaproteobacteria bacterium]